MSCVAWLTSQDVARIRDRNNFSSATVHFWLLSLHPFTARTGWQCFANHSDAFVSAASHLSCTSRAVQSECLSVCYLAHVPKDKSLTNISKCLPMSRSVPTALLKFLAVCHNFVSHRFTTFSKFAEHVRRAVHSARLIIPFRF